MLDRNCSKTYTEKNVVLHFSGILSILLVDFWGIFIYCLEDYFPLYYMQGMHHCNL